MVELRPWCKTFCAANRRPLPPLMIVFRPGAGWTPHSRGTDLVTAVKKWTDLVTTGWTPPSYCCSSKSACQDTPTYSEWRTSFSSILLVKILASILASANVYQQPRPAYASQVRSISFVTRNVRPPKRYLRHLEKRGVAPSGSPLELTGWYGILCRHSQEAITRG